MKKVHHKAQFLAVTASLTCLLSACGGGDTTTGSGGAPKLTDKCSISNINISGGTSAVLSKSSSSLKASFTLNLKEASAITITSNFESRAADDWIEAFPYAKSLAAGNNSVTLQYDLNSPKKSTADSYTKLNITAKFADNTACVANIATNITLNP